MHSVRLLILSFLTLGISAVCPTVSCRDLASNVCASKISATEISLNSVQCSSGNICAATGLFTWLGQLDTFPGDVYECYLDNTGVTLSDLMSTSWPCYTRRTSRDFASSTNLQNCASDQDCKLVDGTVTPGSCACGLRASNSLGICIPDYSSTVFEGYWTACGTKEVISNPVTGFYWYLYMHFYQYINYDVPCAGILWEIQEFQDFKSELSYGAGMGLATFLVISVVN